MPQTASRLTVQTDIVDDPEQPPLTPNKSSRRPRGPKFYDSSGPLFSLYSDIAKEEDNKITEHWKGEATDGVLVFTGLFSAAVAALLSVSVLDLKPNSQDTSAFYLANIFQVLADPNVTVPRTSIPSIIPTPPPFSPPTYAVWVNALWFLSLVVSLTCALLAMLLRQWAHRYIRVTQPARCSPEKRARMRAFFADGVDKMYLPLAVEALPALLHLSLFLFFYGLVIFLFNINNTVYLSSILWIGLFALLYGWMTMMPILRCDSPYYTPLSSVAWLIHNSMRYALATVLASVMPRGHRSRYTWMRFSRKPYGYWMLGGVGKAAEETVRKRSSEIDLGILDWLMVALDEDETLEKFFEAIPGFFNSQMVMNLTTLLPDLFRSKFVDSLCVFLGRNLLSNSVSENVKTRRLRACMNATKKMCHSNDIYAILFRLSSLHFDQVPQSIQTAEILARWFTSRDHHVSRRPARKLLGSILPHVRERDDRWIALVVDQFDIPEHVLRDNITGVHGDDSVLLAILIHMTRKVIRTGPPDWWILSTLSKFNMLNTLPGLQHEFCALWNEIVRTAKDPRDPYVGVLHEIRHVYIALHQGTDAAPTAFDASTADNDFSLCRPSSYPLCNIASHHPNLSVPPPDQLDHPRDVSESPHLSRIEGQSAPQQAEEANIVSGLPFPSRGVDPVHISPQTSSDADLSVHERIRATSPHLNLVPVAITPSTATRSYRSSVSAQHSDSSKQQDIAALGAASNITQTSPTTSNRNPQTIPNIGAALQTREGSTAIPPTIVSDPPSSPIMMAALHTGVIPMELPSSVESALIRPSHILYPLESLSSPLTTARSDVTPQVTLVLDAHVTPNNTRDMARSILMEASRHVEQSPPSTSDFAEDTLALGDRRRNWNGLWQWLPF